MKCNAGERTILRYFHKNSTSLLPVLALAGLFAAGAWAAENADNKQKEKKAMAKNKVEKRDGAAQKPSANEILSRVPDDVFLKTLDDDPHSIMCKIPESITYTYHMPIATVRDGFNLYVDTYYKDKHPAKPRPALIFMHDWAGGKQPLIAGERQCCYFALKDNIFGVVLYYSQPVDGTFPAALQDLKCALRWIRSVADEYAIDPNRIIVMGSSAGTQWTWLAAASNGSKKYDGVGGYDSFSSDVNMAIVNSSICDFVNDFGNRRLGILVMAGKPEDKPELFKEASPLVQIKAGMPPVLMIHGEKDNTCKLESAQAAYDRLQELNVPSELVIRKGCGHGLDGFGIDLKDNLDTMRDFIGRHFVEQATEVEAAKP